MLVFFFYNTMKLFQLLLFNNFWTFYYSDHTKLFDLHLFLDILNFVHKMF